MREPHVFTKLNAKIYWYLRNTPEGQNPANPELARGIGCHAMFSPRRDAERDFVSRLASTAVSLRKTYI